MAQLTPEALERDGGGYTMADSSVYSEEAAERQYRELLALLDRTLATR